MESGKTLSIAIMSGKGGVGKTNLTLNLGYALHMRKQSVLLMDCDLGLANLDVLLGIAPEGNMHDVLLGSADMKSVIHPVAPNGFDVLPAASGVPELAAMTNDMRQLLLDRLTPELGAYDYVLMDAGAGIGETVQAVAAMAALRIVIITPEPTSLTDGYALIKILQARCGVSDFFIVVNQVESEKETQHAFTRLSNACRKFLQIEPTFLASVRNDKTLIEAVRLQQALLAYKPACRAAQDILTLAESVQKIRLGMAEWMRTNPILRSLPKAEN
ncbi:MAG: MinD/ParA family protein [Deltaproteobacteria bacterium]|jgi:flagellar biosynthesis protein FlhG|nr:MinD/ParA family protein [Deltaproteobacteria bacterium]